MRIEVVTGVEPNEETGELEDVVDQYFGDEVSWITEPSGVLVVMSGAKPWVAYAAGVWRRVRPAP